MKTVKSILAIALAIGVLIATILLVIEPLTDYSLLSPELPGITAAYLFWGVVGGSAFLGIAIAWVVNAIVYGAGAFAVLIFLKLVIRALPK
jgi:hypothetical protein